MSATKGTRPPVRESGDSQVKKQPAQESEAIIAMRKRAEQLAKTPTRKTPKECLCGCGEMTLGGRFKIGHNGKLLSRMLKEARARNSVTQTA